MLYWDWYLEVSRQFSKSNDRSVEVREIQLGQLSVIPPGLVLEAGGDFNLAGSYACKVEVPPPLQGSKWGGLQLSRHGCLLS